MINKKRNNLWIYVAGVAVLALIAFAYFKGKNRKEGEKVALEEAQIYPETLVNTLLASRTNCRHSALVMKVKPLPSVPA